MFIYKTTNLINDKKYIGLCSRKSGSKEYVGSGKLLRNAIKKYGINNFKRVILEECSNEVELRNAEIKWISYYNAVNDDSFYNLHAGGRGGDTGFKPETDMSKIVKKTWDSYTEEEKKTRLIKLHQSDKSGKRNSMYGRSIVKEQNLKWYTNGVKPIYVTEGTQPNGFVPGRKIK